MPFFDCDHFDRRIKQQLKMANKDSEVDGVKQRTKEYLVDFVVNRATKRDIADSLQSLAIQINNFIA
jgi:hypothetical protein